MAGRVLTRFLSVLILPTLATGCASADPKRDYRKAETQSEGRQVYSPNFRSDPYLQAKWDASVRSLEAECARSGRYCAEAKKARAAMQRLPMVGQPR